MTRTRRIALAGVVVLSLASLVPQPAAALPGARSETNVDTRTGGTFFSHVLSWINHAIVAFEQWGDNASVVPHG